MRMASQVCEACAAARGWLVRKLRGLDCVKKGNFEDNKMQSQFMYSLDMSTNEERRVRETERKRESRRRKSKVQRRASKLKQAKY